MLFHSLNWSFFVEGSGNWPASLREKAAPPSKDYMLVFVGEGEDQPRAAASIAASKGFERTAILEGGLEAFGSSVLSQVSMHEIHGEAHHEQQYL